MATSEETLKFTIVLLLSAVGLAIFIVRRYGSVWRTLLARLGDRWPRFITLVSIATLVVWMTYWTLIGPEQRAELKRLFQDSSPWGQIKPSITNQMK